MIPGSELISREPGGSVHALIACGQRVRAISAAALHESTDGGDSWRTVDLGAVPPPLYALARVDDALLVAAGNGLWRMSDSTARWDHVLVGGPILTLASQSSFVLAGTEADGLLRSENGGKTWVSANPGLLDTTVLALAMTPTFGADGTAFAGATAGLYRSRNGGRSWRQMALPLGETAVQAIALSPPLADGPLVLAGTEDHGLFISPDVGETWMLVSALGNAGIAAVAISPTAAWLAAATAEGVTLSADGGASWRSVEGVQQTVLSLAFVGDTLLAGVVDDGVLRIDPATGVFQPASAGLYGRLVLGSG